MTTARVNRCAHCRDVYVWHPSVYGGRIPENDDDTFCQSCMEVISKALKAIPRKFEKRWIDSNDYTAQQIQHAQDKRCNEGVPVRRISFPLFNLETGAAQQTVCEQMPDPVSGQRLYYSARWWPSKPDEAEISKEVWWDIQNNKVAEDQRDYRGQ